MEVQQVQPKLIFWKSKKPEILELTPNSHVVIHMDTLDNQSNVIALVPLNWSCHRVRGQFFTSTNLQVVSNLKDMLSRCCDGKLLWNSICSDIKALFRKCINFCCLPQEILWWPLFSTTNSFSGVWKGKNHDVVAWCDHSCYKWKISHLVPESSGRTDYGKMLPCIHIMNRYMHDQVIT